MTSVSCTYELVATGWARCTFSVGEHSATVTASYLSDALGNLSASVVAISTGEETERASFDEEPGEYRWIFERSGSTVRVRILEFSRLWGEQPDDEGIPLLDATCKVVDLCSAVLSALDSVHEQHGIEGYRNRWVEHGFPEEERRQLQQLVLREGARSRPTNK